MNSVNNHDFLFFKNFFSNTVVVLGIICFVGFILRIIWVNHDIPLILDSTGYFWYAIDTSIQGHFPDSDCGWKCSFPNTGWPSFLSIFFRIIDSNNYLDYMNFQRYLSVFFSVLTAIPMFYLSKFFVRKEIAFLSTSIFLFNPRIIENSILGITEPIYIFIFTLMLLTLIKYSKFPFISFSMIGIISIIRYEGILLILPLTLIYFYKSKLSKNSIINYLPCIFILLVILIPWGIMKTELTGTDGIISHVYSGPKYYSDTISESNDKNEAIFSFVNTGLNYTLRFLGIATFPVLILLTPIGFILLIKKRKFTSFPIFIPLIITLMLPIFYAYSRGFLETRYLLILFPIFSIISSMAIEEIFKGKKIKNLLILIIGIIILSSIIFLEFNQKNEISEKFEFAKIVNSKMKVVNTFSGGGFLQETRLELVNDFPILRKDLPEGTKVLYLHRCNPNLIIENCDEKYYNLEDFIARNKMIGLTHIVIDEGFLYNPFLKDDFENSEKYPYLLKIYDTKDEGFDYYDAKIFWIDFQKLEQFEKNR